MGYDFRYDVTRVDLANGEFTISGAPTAVSGTVVDPDGDGQLDSGEIVEIDGVSYQYKGVVYGESGDPGIVVQETGAPGWDYYLYSNDGTLEPGTYDGEVAYQSPVCFLPGTRIATPDGERAIETLQIGDLVTLASGEQKPLRWVGRMTKPLHRFNRRHASPILVKAGALGEGLPRRDLYTSYRHGFALEGVLVIAGLLVNGTSIVQCTDWPEATVTYYQLEVEGHELMLAEGAATETFGEDGDNRALFDNAAEFHALYPDAQPCEPMALGRVIVARQVPQAVRARLAAAAAERATRVA